MWVNSMRGEIYALSGHNYVTRLTNSLGDRTIFTVPRGRYFGTGTEGNLASAGS